MKTKRKYPGGPGRGRTKIDWKPVEKLLVCGEEYVDELTRLKKTRFPSFRELGERFGVSKGSVGRYSKRRKCIERRDERRKLKAEQVIQGATTGPENQRPLSTQDGIQLVNDYIRVLHKNIHEGSVRADSSNDIDKALRLKEFLEGRADSRTEVQGQFTLAMLQEAHARYRDQIINMTPEGGGTADCDPYEEDEAPAEQTTAGDDVLPGQLPLIAPDR